MNPIYRFLVALAAAACALLSAPAMSQRLLWEHLVNDTNAYLGCNHCAGDQYTAAPDPAGNLIVATSSSTGWRILKLAAADGGLLWDRSIGYARPRGVAVDPSGNAIVTGRDGLDNADVRTIKFAAADGAVVWDRTFAGISHDVSSAVAVDALGNAIVVGHTHTATGSTAWIVLKYAAADGSVLWSKTFQSSDTSGSQAYAVALDGGGNAYVTGQTQTGSGIGWHTIKYAGSDGSVLWQTTSPGGTRSSYPNAMVLDAAGNAVVAGVGGSASVDWRMIKYAADDGRVLWEQSFGVGSVGAEEPFSVAVDAAGNAFAAGRIARGEYDYDWAVIKLDANTGAVAWQHVLDHVYASGAHAVAVDRAGNAIVVGSSSATDSRSFRVIKYSGASGAILWDRAFTRYGLTVSLVPGAILAAGHGYDPTLGHGLRIIKLDNSSGSEWNDDGKPDIVWSNTADGATYVWYMNGAALISDAFIAAIDPSWKVQGIADFNSDGHPDLVWRNTANGNTYVWYMNGAAFVSDAFVFGLPPQWVIQGVADFNADGKPDFLMRNTETGVAFAWFFDNATPIGDQFLFGIDPAWKVEQVGDVNGDGQPDLLFRNMTSGLAFAWYTQYAAGSLSLGGSSESMFSIDPAWEIVQLEDWNADGQRDLLFRNRDTGVVFVWYMAGTTLGGSAFVIQIDPTWEIVPRR